MRHESSRRHTKKPLRKPVAVKARPAPAAKNAAKAGSKSNAKSRGLAAVEALLNDSSMMDEDLEVGEVLPQAKRAGAEAGAKPKVKTAPSAAPAAEVVAPPARTQAHAGRAGAVAEAPGSSSGLSRFERCLLRAEKGEPGPVRLADLVLDPQAVARARQAGSVESYRKILEKNPAAQPGRPLVNIVGSGDHDLKLVVLSLHELAAAAREAGRESLQVSLVRLSETEAEALQKTALASAPAVVKQLSPREIASSNGFLELEIDNIAQDENIRAVMDEDSPQFANLVESIRTIGLQNAPVVELRFTASNPPQERYVCVSGHRRLKALKTLGTESVMCALKLFKSEKHRMIATLAENVNRQDLHFLDKADGYGALEAQGMTAGEIASLLDTDQRTISKFLRAASWDDSVKSRIRALGAKTTTRFLLNFLAAGVRTTSELHELLDKFEAAGKTKAPSPSSPRAVRMRLDDYYMLTDCSSLERAAIEKALKYLGFIK